MRTRFIEALTYPRMLMTSTIDIDTCPMHGYFDKTLDACLVCDKGVECLWLNRGSFRDVHVQYRLRRCLRDPRQPQPAPLRV
jgi:hypothetical protein